MRIITVTATFGEEKLAFALKVLQQLKVQSLNMPGCLEYDIYADPQQAGKVFIFQIWTSEETFETYRTGEFFAKMGAEIGPIMTTPPKTDIFEAEAITQRSAAAKREPVNQ